MEASETRKESGQYPPQCPERPRIRGGTPDQSGGLPWDRSRRFGRRSSRTGDVRRLSGQEDRLREPPRLGFVFAVERQVDPVAPGGVAPVPPQELSDRGRTGIVGVQYHALLAVVYREGRVVVGDEQGPPFCLQYERDHRPAGGELVPVVSALATLSVLDPVGVPQTLPPGDRRLQRPFVWPCDPFEGGTLRGEGVGDRGRPRSADPSGGPELHQGSPQVARGGESSDPREDDPQECHEPTVECHVLPGAVSEKKTSGIGGGSVESGQVIPAVAYSNSST